MKHKLIVYYIILFYILITVLPILADDANTIAVRQADIVNRIQELPDKNQQLDTKVYTGTFGDILTQRVVDLNDVIVFSQQITVDANQLCDDMNQPCPPECAVRVVIQRFTEVNDIVIKKGNNEFLHSVNEYVSDSNNLPDPNDPDYLAVVQENAEMLQWCVDIFSTNKFGGL